MRKTEGDFGFFVFLAQRFFSTQRRRSRKEKTQKGGR